MRRILTLAALVGLVAAGAACGGEDDGAAASERPSIVVTTNILGDVVAQALGEAVDVDVVMPAGSDAHDFAPSARQAEAMLDADLLVTNGAGFEEGMADVIDQAVDAGTPVFSFADHVDLLTLGDGDQPDPHLFTDPSRVAAAVDALGGRVADLEGADATAVAASTAAYAEELAQLDSSIEAKLAAVPAERRTLVSNHEVLGYFADRYGFAVVGAVVPSLTTRAAPSAADLTALADTIRDRGVPAIFAETTQSSELADALADEVGGPIEVVELYTESLGEPGSGAETYIGMMETNAARVAEALR